MKNQGFIAFVSTAVAVATALAGCNALNEQMTSRVESVEMYHIYDIKTPADTQTLAKAIANGIAQNTNSVHTALPLQLGKTVPTEPGRFELKDPFNGNRFPGLPQTKVPVCSDAVWTADAKRTTAGSSDLTLYYCLYKYKTGYSLDLYATFVKASGVQQLANSLAEKMVGTAESWVNKTIVDTVREIERVPGTRVKHMEGQPELTDLPPSDKLGQK